MSETGLAASIIVTTRNRAAHMRRLLPSLCQLTYDRLEVIVVVNPCEDDTMDVVEEYRDRMKILTCPVASMCVSRNMGLAVAAGDVVIFIDDDAIPVGRDWVEALVEPFARDPRVGAAGGPVLYHDTGTYQYRNGYVSEYGTHRFTADPNDPGPSGPGWFGRSMGANAAFRREPLVGMGGFDERFVYYGEECDVCVRLARAGYAFAYVERAVVRHYPLPSRHRHVVDRARNVTHGDTYYCLRNAAAPLPVRLARTLWMALGKHYVREVVAARRERAISGREYLRFWGLWARGLAAGIRQGCFATRALMAPPAERPALLPLPRPAPSPRLSIALTARQLACDRPAEGIARYTFDLAEGLQRLGHDVHVIGESAEQTRHLQLGLTVHGISPAEAARRPFQSHPTLSGNIAYALAVAERIRAIAASGVRLDVVHATNWNFEGLGAVIDGGLPVVMMLVTSLAEVIDSERWARNDDLESGVWLDKAQMQAATVAVAPSAGLVRKYLATGLIDADLAARVITTPLGIVPRQAPSAAASGRRLLFVGTHVRRKGLDDLLAALPDVLREHPEWACDLAGDDTRIVDDGMTLKEQFLRQHAGEPWVSRVTFHGRVQDQELWRLYAGAAVYVAPSRFESFGLTYLEAMQFGIPVVATRVGGIPEVVQDGRTGLLIDPGDRDALRATLSRLMSDDRLRARLGDAARRDVQERWTHVHMARRLLPVYQEAIARHRAAPPEDRGPAAQAVVDLIERAGAPPELVTRLRQSATFESGAAGREVLLNAAMGRLPSALYGPAVEACLQAGDADRALRLVEDARTFAADLSDHARAELRELESLARRLAAPGDRSRDAGQPADRHAPPPPAPGSVALSVDDAVALLRDGRVALGMARLLSLADGDGAVPAQRLTASYHLASALKRCGFVGEAEGRFRSLIAAPGFDRLAADVRAAAWFHAGDLSRAAGRPDEAEARFQRCLALNPSHGRAAALLSELRQSGGPAAAGRGRETR